MSDTNIATWMEFMWQTYDFLFWALGPFVVEAPSIQEWTHLFHSYFISVMYRHTNWGRKIKWEWNPTLISHFKGIIFTQLDFLAMGCRNKWTNIVHFRFLNTLSSMHSLYIIMHIFWCFLLENVLTFVGQLPLSKFYINIMMCIF